METLRTDPDSQLGALRVADAVRERRARHREAELLAAESSWFGLLTACAQLGVETTMLIGGRRQVAVVEAASRTWVAVRADGCFGLVRADVIEAIEGVEVTADACHASGVPASEPPLHLEDVLAGYSGTAAVVRLVPRSGGSITGIVEACGADVVHLRMRSGSRRCYVALDSVNELWSSSRP